MKINCIYLGKVPFREDKIINPEKELLDGTHTEGFYLANVLEKYSHCMVFCSVEKRIFNSNGVEFINYAELDDYIKYYNFDNVFAMVGITDKIIRNVKCNRLYLLPSCEDVQSEITKENLSFIYKIGYLSEHQKYTLSKDCNGLLMDNRHIFLKWFNAIDDSLYNNIKEEEKENAMVWSSMNIRGSDWLFEKVVPLIREEIPDFKFYQCNYLSDNEEFFTDDNVRFFFGKVGKEKLAELQKKAKIWVYPNLGILQNYVFFNETFCNTAVENAMAGNAIVCLDKGGISTTLSGYSGLIEGKIFDETGIMYEDDFNRVFKALAERSIQILKDDSYRKELVSESKKISNQYTLKSFEDFWVKELNLNFK